MQNISKDRSMQNTYAEAQIFLNVKKYLQDIALRAIYPINFSKDFQCFRKGVTYFGHFQEIFRLKSNKNILKNIFVQNVSINRSM